jgi:hypothetical protein
LVSALALGLVTQVARAEEPDASTRMAARELAVAGAEAFDKHDYARALDRFQRAESLYKVPSITVMVARCLAGIGRVVEAVDKYEETSRMPLDAAAPEAFQRAVADATAEIEPARARVARIELRLPADAPGDVAVTLDKKPVPAALIGVPTPVDPGDHHLVARAKGRVTYEVELTLSEGSRQTVRIALPEPTPLPPGQSSKSVRWGASSRRPSTLTVALLTGGAIAIAAGTVTGVAALSHKSSLDSECKPGCPAKMSSDLDSYRMDRTLSYVSFGIGIAAAGAGTYLLFHRSESGTQLGALVMPGGAALEGSF